MASLGAVPGIWSSRVEIWIRRRLDFTCSRQRVMEAEMVRGCGASKTMRGRAQPQRNCGRSTHPLPQPHLCPRAIPISLYPLDWIRSPIPAKYHVYPSIPPEPSCSNICFCDAHPGCDWLSIILCATVQEVQVSVARAQLHSSIQRIVACVTPPSHPFLIRSSRVSRLHTVQ